MPTKEIRLARELVLPLDLVTQKIAILGNPEMGKSATATRLVEQLHGADLQTVVLDVKGDWWGIRSSRDGKGTGLPFVIFGGEHADVPLEPTAGALIADAVVDYRISAIIDLSLMSKTKARRFTTAFAEQLYMRNRDPLMLVVDEADVLIPQRAEGETARLIGAMEDIAKRGRGRGLGLTIASQRGQEVNKSVLDIMGNVLLFGITGRLTIKAVSEWIGVNAANDEISSSEVIASLPSLQTGEAWFWSPSFMRTVVRVRMDMFTTFDSKATPKAGEKRIVPIKRAEIDLARLGEEISATVERAKAADPTALRKRVVELERQLAQRDQSGASDNARLSQYEEMLGEAGREIDSLQAQLLEAQGRTVEFPPSVAYAVGQVLKALEEGTAEAQGALALIDKHNAEVSGETHTSPPASTAQRTPKVEPRRSPAPAAAQQRPPARQRPAAAPAGTGEGIAMPKAERAILSALAPYAPAPRSAKQVALIGQYSSKGGGFRNALGALRSKGFIDGSNNSMTITEEGLAALGSYEPLPTGAALVEHWCNSSVLGKAEAAALRAIVAAYPNAISSVEVAEQAGYEPGGGGFRNALGKLRSLELIVGGNAGMRASDELIG